MYVELVRDAPSDEMRTSALFVTGPAAVVGKSAEWVSIATTAFPAGSTATPTPMSSRLPPNVSTNTNGEAPGFVSSFQAKASRVAPGVLGGRVHPATNA